MTETPPAEWSPADNPYAIAVSEAHWWLLTANLAIARIRDGDDRRLSFSSQQIDARQLVVALCQLLVAEQLEQAALRTLGIDQSVRDALRQARQRFEQTLPGIKHMRDALMHFDEWSRGTGLGPQRVSRQAGQAERDVARAYWRFAYNPSADTISLGPYTINVDTAGTASTSLAQAINLAAHQVDTRTIADLRASAVQALSSAGIPYDSTENTVHISPGTDARIWISLPTTKSDSIQQGHQDLPTQIVDALTIAGLRPVSHAYPENHNAVELLAQGHALQVEANNAAISDATSRE